MPRRDKIHQAVLNALAKYGVTITDDPLSLEFDDRTIYADVGGVYQERKLAVEFKEFAGKSPMTDLADAIGQVILYQFASENSHDPRQMFLAIPDTVFEFWEGEMAQALRKQYDINLILVDIEKEEVTQWNEAKNLS